MTEQELSRRTVLKGAAVTAGALTLGPNVLARSATAAESSPAYGTRPNFVLIMTDDQGYGDLESYGAPLINTPNIDGLGQRGIRFVDSYAGSPLCTPSRASLLTGCWPPRVNMPDVLNPVIPFGDRRGMSQQETLLPEYLKTAGYATGHFGKWHLGDPEASPLYHPMEHGFDRWYGIPYSNDYPTIPVYDDRTITQRIVYPGALGQDAGPGDEQNWLNRSIFEKAMGWIEDHADEPFFAYIAPSQPHEPVASEFQGSAGGPHGSSIEEMDMLLGRILQRLEDLGVRENTVVVFTSDNGPWWVGDVAGLKGRKGETYEGGIKVPFLMEWPARMSGSGKVYDGVTTHADVLPTFCAAAGVPLRADRVIDGRSLLPVIEKGEAPGFFASLVTVIDGYATSGQITTRAATSLRDRLTRAERSIEQGNEAYATGYLEQLVTRARSQIKGDADDIAARDAIIAAAEAAIVKVGTHVDVAYYQSNNLNAIRYGEWKVHVRRVANPTRHTGLRNWEATEGMPELYDLSRDPEESYDLSEHHPEQLADMIARLQAFDAALKADRAAHYGT
jgi:arylsulfatase A